MLFEVVLAGAEIAGLPSFISMESRGPRGASKRPPTPGWRTPGLNSRRLFNQWGQGGQRNQARRFLRSPAQETGNYDPLGSKPSGRGDVRLDKVIRAFPTMALTVLDSLSVVAVRPV